MVEVDGSGVNGGHQLGFRVLGPVEVVANGKLLPITAARERIVLAMLMLEADRIVPLTRLIDAVWDEDPPSTARLQVQIVVSKLRRKLAAHGGRNFVITHPPGYQLQVPGNLLDLSRFTKLVTTAERDASRDAAVAVTCYRQALALWRGDAAADVPSQIVANAAIRHGEIRLATLEACLELELELGRHHQVTAELSELVSEHPLRERLCGMLMIALYRSGRQAEALEVYQQCREVLGEQGLEPCKMLRELQQAIFTEDSALSVPSHASLAARGLLDQADGGAADAAEVASPPSHPVPRQLPAAPADFTGRHELLERITSVVPATALTRSPVIVLSGRGGVGKTALALQAAHLLREHFPDGDLYTELRGETPHPSLPGDVLERFLRSLGMAGAQIPASEPDRMALYRSLLACRRMLIVLDDITSLDQLERLLPGTPGCLVIATTRAWLSGPPGGIHIDVGPLDESACAEMLTRTIGRDRTIAEVRAVGDLIRFCEGLPLALRIVAAKLAARPHWRIARMAERLADEQRRLDELDHGSNSVAATLKFAYQELSERHRLLLRGLGLVGQADFAAWVTVPLIDVSLTEGEDLVEDLVAARLVEAKASPDGAIRYRLHDLVRLYCAKLVTHEEKRMVLSRYLGCWLALADEAHRRYHGSDLYVSHGDAQRWPLSGQLTDLLVADPLRWFRAERQPLVAAILHAADIGMTGHSWDLAVTSVTLFELDPGTNDWQITHDAALAATRAAGDDRGTASLLSSLGQFYRLRDPERARACLMESLRISERLKDEELQAYALDALASIDRLRADYQAAMSRYRHALRAFERAGDLAGQASILRCMGQVLTDQGQFYDAEALLEQAIKLANDAGSSRQASQAMYYLGEVYRLRGQLDQAKRLFYSVREATRRIDDHVGHGYALLGLATAISTAGDDQRAAGHLRKATLLAERTGHKLLYTQVLLARTQLVLGSGETISRRDLLQAAKATLIELGWSPLWWARCLEAEGRLFQTEGLPGEAVRCWQTAADLVGDIAPALANRLTEALADVSGQTPPPDSPDTSSADSDDEDVPPIPSPDLLCLEYMHGKPPGMTPPQLLDRCGPLCPPLFLSATVISLSPTTEPLAVIS